MIYEESIMNQALFCGLGSDHNKVPFLMEFALGFSRET
jgi:hypothetical protein